MKNRCDLMIKKKNEIDLDNNKVIDKPDDVLRKIAHAYLGKTVHEYFGLPGKYKHNIENEFPDKDGQEKRTDGAYIVEDDGKDLIINIEDESSIVNKKTLVKSYGYCVNMQYAYKLPVYSVITTPIPLNKCTNMFCPSKTLKYLPHIISFNELDGNKRLEYARAKVKNDEPFSTLEGYDLINIPKMFMKNQEKVLEEVCNLFSRMKMDDQMDKFKLAKGLECVIHKYAKSNEEIENLMDVINMTKVSEDLREIVREVYKEEIEENGKKERIEERVDLSRKFAEKYNIDEVSKISGISKEQILNKK